MVYFVILEINWFVCCFRSLHFTFGGWTFWTHTNSWLQSCSHVHFYVCVCVLNRQHTAVGVSVSHQCRSACWRGSEWIHHLNFDPWFYYQELQTCSGYVSAFWHKLIFWCEGNNVLPSRMNFLFWSWISVTCTFLTASALFFLWSLVFCHNKLRWFQPVDMIHLKFNLRFKFACKYKKQRASCLFSYIFCFNETLISNRSNELVFLRLPSFVSCLVHTVV